MQQGEVSKEFLAAINTLSRDGTLAMPAFQDVMGKNAFSHLLGNDGLILKQAVANAPGGPEALAKMDRIKVK